MSLTYDRIDTLALTINLKSLIEFGKQKTHYCEEVIETIIAKMQRLKGIKKHIFMYLCDSNSTSLPRLQQLTTMGQWDLAHIIKIIKRYK